MNTQPAPMHTPGPWRYSTEPQPNGCPIVGDAKGLMVCMVAHSVKQADQKTTALANARLIASAPALLAALQDLFLSTSLLRVRLAERARPLLAFSEYGKNTEAMKRAEAALSAAQANEREGL